MLTNSLGATDEPLVYAGYARYRKAMLEQGVIIHEFRADALIEGEPRYSSFGSSTGPDRTPRWR